VAGLGAIGLLHARHLADLSGACLALVVDADAALASAAGEELGVPWSTAYEDALGDSGVAAVVLATPTPLHAEMAERAARAAKHVFCEKPLSLEPGSGRAASAAAEAAGVCLQVGFQRRFDADFLAAKARVDAGELGRVQLLRISHRNRVPPHEGDLSDRLGGPFVDMTIHDFDTARWLVGEIAEVNAFASGRSGVVVARFENGALGVIDNTRSAVYGFECAVELMGDRSTIRVGWEPRAPVEQLTPDGRIAPLPADHVERHREAYVEELRHFIACVRSGTPPAVGGADSAAALELSLAAQRCAG
jgi:myo-inositol 2-dehydrogenase/D-chiro-inositol 1-dehydrogenase